MSKHIIPDWLDPEPWLSCVQQAGPADVKKALAASTHGVREFAALISAAAEPFLEVMAQQAQSLTRRHFGRTICLYVPLYVSNLCKGGCAYCGFAADRSQVRRKLRRNEIGNEMKALKQQGFDDVLLLTGERSPEAGFEYLAECVQEAVMYCSNVSIESFAMTEEEYGHLARSGCAGVTLYQETYDPSVYRKVHRWGDKRDYRFRAEAPQRALEAGLRTAGMGVLLGLAEVNFDLLALFRHVQHLRRQVWQGGVMVSFPRLRPEQGCFHVPYPVDDKLLARIIFAFRICLPDVPLVLSTRESSGFRDGIAGIGISRMSVGSRTSVGGYDAQAVTTGRQFDVNDARSAEEFCSVLRAKGLFPVFKNWDAAFMHGTQNNFHGGQTRALNQRFLAASTR